MFSQHELFIAGRRRRRGFIFFFQSKFVFTQDDSWIHVLEFSKGKQLQDYSTSLTINLTLTAEDPRRLITLISRYRRWALQLIPDHRCSTRTWRQKTGLWRWRHAPKHIFHISVVSGVPGQARLDLVPVQNVIRAVRFYDHRSVLHIPPERAELLYTLNNMF